MAKRRTISTPAIDPAILVSLDIKLTAVREEIIARLKKLIGKDTLDLIGNDIFVSDTKMSLPIRSRVSLPISFFNLAIISSRTAVSFMSRLTSIAGSIAGVEIVLRFAIMIFVVYQFTICCLKLLHLPVLIYPLLLKWRLSLPCLELQL